MEDICCGLLDEVVPDSEIADLKSLLEHKSSIATGDALALAVRHHVIKETHSDWLKLGVWSVQAFVQANFMGPPLASERSFGDNAVLKHLHSLSEDQLKSFISGALKLEDECSDISFSALCQSLEYLALAKLIFVDSGISDQLPSVFWWSLRVFCLWQQVLSDKSPHLHSQVRLAIQQLDLWLAGGEAVTLGARKELMGRFYVECTHAFLAYHDVKAASDACQKAVDLCGLNVCFTGQLGKRTRFQTFDVAQLAMTVSSTDSSGRMSPTGGNEHKSLRNGSAILPIDRKLDDDTLLERVNFSVDLPQDAQLSPIDQGVLLAYMATIRRSFAHEALLLEQLNACIDAQLRQTVSSWCVKSATLYARCQIEAAICAIFSTTRKVERCMLQMQELVDQFARPEPSGKERLRHFFASPLPPIWIVKKDLAGQLRRLGCTQEALAQFESLRMFEEVIDCYASLGKKAQAEHLIISLLESSKDADKAPEAGGDPNLWILLGDLTLNPEHYEKAWELSKHRSAKAQRGLGMLYYVRKDYAKAAAAFELAVELQPLHVDAWYCLGYCAMQTSQHALAAKAYHRCVGIEPDNFEAWNNLSAAYVQLKQKDRAFKTLEEALKYNFESWKIWENFMLVAVDTGHFKDAITAYHRLLDLKEKWTDIEVLKALTKVATTECHSDAEPDKAAKFKADLLKLFGHLTSKVTADADIWQLYASLVRPAEPLTAERANFDACDKHLRMSQRAYQCSVQAASQWERTADSRDRISRFLIGYADGALEFNELFATSHDSACNGFLASVRLALKSAIAKLKQFLQQLTADETGLESAVKRFELKLAEVELKLSV